jgi:DNA-binding NarL/FixJ family response regulator
MPIARVVIADDDAMVRDALADLIRDEARLDLVGVAADADELVAEIARLKPEIVVLDGRMPGGGGAAALVQIREHWPDTIVVAMSAYDDDKARTELAGADAYVVKGAPGPSILDVLLDLLP